MKKVVFLDRDGVLVRDKEYMNEIKQIELEERVVPALRYLQEAGYALVVVTNQSGIGRGLVKLEEYEAIRTYLHARFQDNGIEILAEYYCPHHPTEAQGEYLQDCDCRKPKPGMLHRAQEAHGIDMEKSFMVGDKASDIEAGRTAGVKTVLVRSGLGAKSIADIRENQQPSFVAEDLYDGVVNFILA